ncbi:MAG: tetratricopeptide repeat protein [Ignavibacteriales bacterium]|nr:tetratricopeptide repeat protein [Ignavibacteriales bacterium]
MAKQTHQRSKPLRKERRKLAAIMFTDMVGYSALVQKNEKLAMELLEEHNRLLRASFPKFNGKEIKTIGDAFLVEFSSALDATRCAVDIQKVLEQRNARVRPERMVQIKIGLHVGDVIYRGKDVFGDGVNIASRIEPVAGPGGICLSEDVARQVQNKLDYPLIRLGRGELKNIEVPVELYKVFLPWQQKLIPFSDRIGFVLRQKRSRLFATLTGILLLMIGMSWMIFETYLSRVQANSSLPEKSVAVLPFQNIGENAEDEYLVDGITESLITDVARIPGLFVIARNSVFQYKGKPVKAQSVGEELKVRYVLEGSIQRAANKLRVTAQLIDAMTENLVWGSKFDPELKDIFAVQDSISMSIVNALQVTFSALEQSKMKAERPTNIDAQELYWKGLTHGRRRTKADNDLAIQYLNHAMEKDSRFAPAHATLASTLRFRFAFGFERNPSILDQVRQQVDRALELNPTLPEGMLVKGLLQREEGDLAGAIQTLLRLYEMFPHDAQCLYYLGNAYRDVGDLSKAVDFHKKALDVDPLYIFNAYNLAIDYWQLRQTDQLELYANKTISLDPNHFVGQMMKAYLLGLQGKENEALEAMARTIAAEPNHLDSYGVRASILVSFGRFDEAVKDLRYLLGKDPNSFTGIIAAIPLLVNLGKFNEAQALIESTLRFPVLPLVQGLELKAFLKLYDGIIKRETGKQELAQKHFEEARMSVEQHLARFPQSPTLRSLHSAILSMEGRFDQAFKEVELAISAIPGRYDFVFDLARLHAMRGDKVKMLAALQKAVDLGQRDFANMEIDIFLKKYRQDPGFVSFFETAGKKYLTRTSI